MINHEIHVSITAQTCAQSLSQLFENNALLFSCLLTAVYRNYACQHKHKGIRSKLPESCRCASSQLHAIISGNNYHTVFYINLKYWYLVPLLFQLHECLSDSIDMCLICVRNSHSLLVRTGFIPSVIFARLAWNSLLIRAYVPVPQGKLW